MSQGRLAADQLDALSGTMIGQGAQLAAATRHGDAASVDDGGEHAAFVQELGHAMPPGSRWCRWGAHTVTGVLKYGNSVEMCSGSGAIPVANFTAVFIDRDGFETISFLFKEDWMSWHRTCRYVAHRAHVNHHHH